ncbi:MAG: PAS domain S-box protein [Polyangiaceae bacterium]|nr:PAS domain S-box protein [Polyangiaceae bacterium]
MCEPGQADKATRDGVDRRLRALVAMAPIAMLETTIDGSVSWANNRWAYLTGATSSDALEGRWFDAVHPDDLARVVEAWRRATSEHVSITIECRFVVTSTVIRWIQFNGAPLFDPSTSTTTYAMTATDVTDKHELNEMARTTTGLESWAEQSAAALAEQGKELGIFAALVASSADAIVIVDPRGKARYANGAFRKLFDIGLDASLDELFIALGVDDSTKDTLRAASAAGESWRSTVVLERPRLGTLHVDLSSFSIIDTTSRTIGMAIMIRDLSIHKEAEVERSRLHAEIIVAQEAAIRELSTPLLPIGPRVIAMPLIGSIDATRGQRILDTLLAGINRHHADFAILDVTGVRRMDADIADILLRSANAAKLLGANVILTGVSPFVAKTLIELGADMSGIRTLATLEQGIDAAFSRTRFHTKPLRRDVNPSPK